MLRDRKAALERKGETDAAAEVQAILEEAKRMEDRAVEVESRLVDVHLTGAREDAFRNPMKLYGRLSALASDVGASGADFRPTDQQLEVHDVLRERLERAAEETRAYFTSEVEPLNRMLRERRIPVVVGEG